MVVTDYPDTDLIDNLSHNIDASKLQIQILGHIGAQGFLWGSSVETLLSHLPRPSLGFDVLLLADLLFNHHCHGALVSTVTRTLAHTPEACALVFFTPYRPWLLEKDLAFFELCKEKGLAVHKVLERVMDKPMFEQDVGDELLRRTVFGYELIWNDLRDKQWRAT